METLNICIGTYRLAKGNGIDVSVYQFARELAKRHNVTIAIADSTIIDSDMDLQGFDVIRCNPFGFSGMINTAKEIDNKKFDIISTHYSPFDLIASLTHIPHYLHDPGIPPYNMMRGFNNKRLWASVNAMRLLSTRRIQCVLPISNYLGREFVRKYLYRGCMKTLPYGIEFPEHDPEESIPFDNYILYVGRHTPYKGVHKLIEIFGEVKKEVGDSVHLVTIGKAEDAAYKERLEVLAAKVGNVHMIGYVADVWPYYANATVYATCSEWEGQDRPVIEAQYMGKPAVTFNNCSHPEVVLYGSLVKDKKDFKEAIIKHLIENDTNISIREKIVNEFSLSKMVSRFLRIIE